MSTGNVFSEVLLSQHRDALIIGENGAGKSTILDALTFALFGKAFRKINKSSLINSVNTKECVVEIEFDIGKKQYKVVRGIKPNVFEIHCNGTLLNQDSASKDYQEHLEKFILKMNYKSFTQIVVLGSASFTPFMQLSASDRRSIIEDLLDIEIFSKMNVIAKQKYQQNKELIERNRISLDGKEEKKSYVEKTIHNLKQNNESKKLSLQGDNDHLRHAMADLKSALHAKEADRDSAIQEGKAKIGARDKHKKLIALQSKIETNLNHVRSDRSFFAENDSCPTCRQSIDAGFKAESIQAADLKIDEYGKGISQIKLEIDKCVSIMDEVEALLAKATNLNNDITSIKHQIEAIVNKIDTNLKLMETLDQSDTILQDSETELTNIIKDIQTLSQEREALLDEKVYLETAIALLKDGGIKTKIIKQYLPIINKTINKYLTKLGFFVNFNIDENFEETIKSRYRDDFSYQNFSEGEKMRIDLAILFAWRTIAKLKNSVNTNLLILDEVCDSSLDNNGTDEFLKIIKGLAKDTNVFIISHKQDQLLDKFEKIYHFVKKKNFSIIAV